MIFMLDTQVRQRPITLNINCRHVTLKHEPVVSYYSTQGDKSPTENMQHQR